MGDLFFILQLFFKFFLFIKLVLYISNFLIKYLIFLFKNSINNNYIWSWKIWIIIFFRKINFLLFHYSTEIILDFWCNNYFFDAIVKLYADLVIIVPPPHPLELLYNTPVETLEINLYFKRHFQTFIYNRYKGSLRNYIWMTCLKFNIT